MDVNELGARIIISFGDGKVFINESILYGLIVALILAVLGIWLGTGLKKIPKGKQIIAEAIVGAVYKFADSNMGESGERFAPYVGTIFSFILFGSMLGLFGLRPTTADVNVTFSLSILTFLIIQIFGTKAMGIKGKIKHMCDPYPFMFPLKILEDCTLPVSLGFRLFGNILGGLIIVDLFLGLMTKISNLIVGIPFLRMVTVLPLNAFFDIFEPVIQTYIFTMLTMVFLAMVVNVHHGGDEEIV